jgi:cytochrome c-type biogenesis protein CcmF
MPIAAFALCAFAAVVTLRELFLPARARMTEQQESAWLALARSASRAPRRFGGYIVHLGIVLIVIAIAASSAFKVHTTAKLVPGGDLAVGNYRVRWDGVSNGKEAHRDWTAANITITAPNGSTETLVGLDAPRQNFYERSTDPVGSPAVRARVFEDVYVSLLAIDPREGTASFNAWIFPMVGWIWYSIPLLVLGSVIALWPQRKRATAPAVSVPPATEPPPADLPAGAGAT